MAETLKIIRNRVLQKTQNSTYLCFGIIRYPGEAQPKYRKLTKSTTALHFNRPRIRKGLNLIDTPLYDSEDAGQVSKKSDDGYTPNARNGVDATRPLEIRHTNIPSLCNRYPCIIQISRSTRKPRPRRTQCTQDNPHASTNWQLLGLQTS